MENFISLEEAKRLASGDNVEANSLLFVMPLIVAYAAMPIVLGQIVTSPIVSSN